MTRFALGLLAFGAAFAQTAAVVEVVKNVEPAAIVVAATEHRGVMAAARDLQRDITKITGVTPNIVHSLGSSPTSYIVLSELPRTGGGLSRRQAIAVSALTIYKGGAPVELSPE